MAKATLCAASARDGQTHGRVRSGQQAPQSSENLEAQEILDDREREKQEVPGERQGEATGDLKVEPGRRQWICDGLVNIGCVGVIRLRHQSVRELRHKAALIQDVEECIREHLATPEAGIESTDEGLDHACDNHHDDFDARVDDGRNPVVQVLRHDVCQHRATKAVRGEGQHVADPQRDRNCLRELELERRDDSDVDVTQSDNGLLQAHRVLYRHHGDFRLVVDQIIGCHLLHVLDAVLVFVLLLVLHLCLRDEAALVPDDLQMAPHVRATQVQCGLYCCDGRVIHAAKEAEPCTEDHRDHIHRE
mmetsp:Transcript_113756/g.223134  ORF Transcript_113756/g.223134 Transcript_113756/m.223134 type:complete len:305 (-) Transcript_113756:368-1282(-)